VDGWPFLIFLLQRPDSGRRISRTLGTVIPVTGVALADFNGDRRLDLLLVYNEFTSRVLFGDDKGGFTGSGRAIGPQGFSGTSARVVDIEGEGSPRQSRMLWDSPGG
jgi:hypothetical protein